jgi:rare lipoprotein A
MRRRRPIGLIDGRVVAFGAVALGCLALTNCTTNGTSSRVDPRYGVSASPRVVEPGQPVPKGGGTYRVGKPYMVGGRMYVPEENRRYREDGIASWYGDDFHGRLTANGEVYDMEGISAAHPTLPIPSYARVTNLRNGHSIIVRVNDRGPYHNDRLIDLSSKAADLLAFRKTGTSRVRVEYVGPAPLEGSDDRQLMATLREDAPAPLPSSVRVASSRPFEPVEERVRAPARVEMPVATRRDYEPIAQRPSTIARMDAPEPAPRRQEPSYERDPYERPSYERQPPERPTYERPAPIARAELAAPALPPARTYDAPAGRPTGMARNEVPIAAARQVDARHPEPRQAASGQLGELMFSNGRLAGAIEAPASARTVASAPLPAAQTRAAPVAAYSEPRLDRGGQVTSGRGLY